MIDCDVGEAESLGLGHAAAGNLGYDINNFSTHLSNGFFAPQHGTEVHVHVVLHHAIGALVGSYLQHGSDGIARRCAPTCCEDDGLTVEVIETMMSQVECRLVRFDKNDVYALAGSPCRYADIIIEGELTARMVGPSGKFVQMAARGIGTLMAPAFIFTKENKFPVSIETNKPTTIIRMSPQMLFHLLKLDDRIMINFIRQLSLTSNFLAKKVRIFTLHTVREKVAIFLLEESKRSGSSSFTLKKSRQEIADSFAIQKFSLQRCLNEFAAEGAITLDGKNITIIDEAKVRTYASI